MHIYGRPRVDPGLYAPTCTYMYLFLIKMAAYVFSSTTAPSERVSYRKSSGGRWPVLIEVCFARSTVRDADCENMLIVISDSQDLSNFHAATLENDLPTAAEIQVTLAPPTAGESVPGHLCWVGVTKTRVSYTCNLYMLFWRFCSCRKHGCLAYPPNITRGWASTAAYITSHENLL